MKARQAIVISDNVMPRCGCGTRKLKTLADLDRPEPVVGEVGRRMFELAVRVECVGCTATWTWGEQ